MQCRFLGRICPKQPGLSFKRVWTRFIWTRFSAGPVDYYQNRDHGRNLPIVPARTIQGRKFAQARPEGDSGSLSQNFAQVAEQGLPALERKISDISQTAELLNEETARSSLQSCEAYAKLIAEARKPSRSPSQFDASLASTLLSLEEQQASFAPLLLENIDLELSTTKKIASRVSRMAYSIVTGHNVFITPEMLASYVNTQSLLDFPETIPQVFVLYASKPVPQPGSSPPRYSVSSRNKASSAIPLAIAKVGLTAAIKARDLPVCFDIINTSVCTTAFRRSKFIRRALLPVITGFGLVPVATYTLASQLSTYQDTMDPTAATNMAFAGILAYVGFTATIGVVAVTTSNDQMDRITWATGTPLRERWLREEERALIDQVAGAWGFKDLSKRGEEEGRDWETLREWVGMRGMMLDRVELMEGME